MHLLPSLLVLLGAVSVSGPLGAAASPAEEVYPPRIASFASFLENSTPPEHPRLEEEFGVLFGRLGQLAEGKSPAGGTLAHELFSILRAILENCLRAIRAGPFLPGTLFWSSFARASQNFRNNFDGQLPDGTLRCIEGSLDETCRVAHRVADYNAWGKIGTTGTVLRALGDAKASEWISIVSKSILVLISQGSIALQSQTLHWNDVLVEYDQFVQGLDDERQALAPTQWLLRVLCSPEDHLWQVSPPHTPLTQDLRPRAVNLIERLAAVTLGTGLRYTSHGLELRRPVSSPSLPSGGVRDYRIATTLLGSPPRESLVSIVDGFLAEFVEGLDHLEASIDTIRSLRGIEGLELTISNDFLDWYSILRLGEWLYQNPELGGERLNQYVQFFQRTHEFCTKHRNVLSPWLRFPNKVSEALQPLMMMMMECGTESPADGSQGNGILL